MNGAGATIEKRGCSKVRWKAVWKLTPLPKYISSPNYHTLSSTIIIHM
jgi:hypothetical protein